MSFLIQSHQAFFGCPLCLIPPTSHVIRVAVSFILLPPYYISQEVKRFQCGCFKVATLKHLDNVYFCTRFWHRLCQSHSTNNTLCFTHLLRSHYVKYHNCELQRLAIATELPTNGSHYVATAVTIAGLTTQQRCHSGLTHCSRATFHSDIPLLLPATTIYTGFARFGSMSAV